MHQLDTGNKFQNKGVSSKPYFYTSSICTSWIVCKVPAANCHLHLSNGEFHCQTHSFYSVLRRHVTPSDRTRLTTIFSVYLISTLSGAYKTFSLFLVKYIPSHVMPYFTFVQCYEYLYVYSSPILLCGAKLIRPSYMCGAHSDNRFVVTIMRRNATTTLIDIFVAFCWCAAEVGCGSFRMLSGFWSSTLLLYI